jgi:hypothetical protein
MYIIHILEYIAYSTIEIEGYIISHSFGYEQILRQHSPRELSHTNMRHAPHATRRGAHAWRATQREGTEEPNDCL